MTPYSAIWASSSAGSAGTAILVSERLLALGGFSWVSNSFFKAADGRLVGARCSWGGHKLALACIYGPSRTSQPSAQRSFLFSSLFLWLNQQGNASKIVGGDFNFVLEGGLDRRISAAETPARAPHPSPSSPFPRAQSPSTPSSPQRGQPPLSSPSTTNCGCWPRAW